MKRYLVFITILLSSISEMFACGYSPYGEDVRYSLFTPEYFDYPEFKAFNYNASLFGFDFEYDDHYESNVYDWHKFTKKKVPIEQIAACLYELKQTDINSSSPNLFVQYLYKNKLNNVIQYIITAKKCEDINSINISNTWEKDENLNLNKNQFLTNLIKKTKSEKSKYLKRKYAFITMRAAFYLGDDQDIIKTLFKKYFARGEKDYLYYWALFFNCFVEENPSVDIANIMAYSTEKKYACYYYFHENFKLNKGLAKAKTKSDVANVYAYASVQRLEPNLDYLKKIYENSRKSRILDFLLLREINKIEDWVYTPYYTNYLPSTETDGYWWCSQKSEIETTQTLRARSEKDRLYAKQVLNFIDSIDYSKIKDIALWKAAKIQLLFITRDYDECLHEINLFESKYAKHRVTQQLEKIKALCIISNQEYGKAIIKNEAQAIILKYLNDERFLFSLGRELEFKGNLSDGLALISFANKHEISNSENYFTGTIEWQGNRLKNTGNLEYFYNYFEYLDFVYSANELQIVVNKLNSNIKGDFFNKIYSYLISDKNYIKDLLGTKYVRENRLMKALSTFQSIGQKYWDENYNAWERDKYDDYYTFDNNPFYDFKYTEDFIPHKEKFIVTKLSVTQHLIKYLRLANNPNNKDRDYYYFLIGNCYYNMTQYGNSWMMRRFSAISNYNDNDDESYIDEIEYRNAQLAQKYYHLAYKTAKTKKFKALCLRMVDYVNANSIDFASLKSTYPEYYDELSSCVYLENYFNARR